MAEGADGRIIQDLVTAIVAAYIGGLIAQRLRQPVILGYFLGGFAMNVIPIHFVDSHNVEIFAELGVALLMFAVGIEISPREIRSFGRSGLLVGFVQVALTVALGVAIAPMMGMSLRQGILIGALLALTSTVVTIRVLLARSETGAPHGRFAVGVCVAQDIAMVPMVALLPILTSASVEDPLPTLGSAFVSGAMLVAAVYLVGLKVAPWLLDRAAFMRSHELFLLGSVSFALGVAALSQFAGFSLAFGAFLAGLGLATSGYRAQIIGEVRTLRDLFASLFFVSLGLLLQPYVVVTRADALVTLLAATLLGKGAIVVAAGALLGQRARMLVPAALVLATMGEFSFVLARLGIASGALSSEDFDLIVATALISILIAPFLPRLADPLITLGERIPLLRTSFTQPVEIHGDTEGLRNHTVICGYGRVARELASALAARRFTYVVVELNPEIVATLRARGVPVAYGDAANPVVMEHLRLERARLLAVLIPDGVTAELICQHARSLHPRLDIVARAVDERVVNRLRAIPVSEVVQPEFEAGIEVINHALRRYGVVGPELAQATMGRRAAFYRRVTSEEEGD